MRERARARKTKTPPSEPQPEPLSAAERFVANWRAEQERLNTVRYFPSPV
jgi:hypothetical protein